MLLSTTSFYQYCINEFSKIVGNLNKIAKGSKKQSNPQRENKQKSVQMTPKPTLLHAFTEISRFWLDVKNYQLKKWQHTETASQFQLLNRHDIKVGPEQMIFRNKPPSCSQSFKDNHKVVF